MAWARFDDLYDDNRKIKKAWRSDRAAIGLHAMAITYCSRHATDGLVDIEWVTERLPAPRERVRVIGVLVECELFEPVDAGVWRVHDFLDYNPSRADLTERRAKDAARKARGRDSPVRLESVRSPLGVRAESERTPSGLHSESARPVPARPVGTGPTPVVRPLLMPFSSAGRASARACARRPA